MIKLIFCLLFLSFIWGCEGSRFAEQFVSKHIEEGYDKFKNTTLYKTRPRIEIISDFGSDVSFWASYVCSEERNCTPSKVLLNFYHSSQFGYRYTYTSELIYIVDGKRMNLGILDSYDFTRHPSLPKIRVEQMSKYISFDDFKLLAYGKIVEGRLGSDEFKFSYEDREVLRMMVKNVQK